MVAATTPRPAPPSALTVTTAIRTALRRILAGEPVGDLAHVLGSLYLHDLVEDDMVNRLPFVTPLGLELLAAHDKLAPTVKVERPRLESRPLPARWSKVAEGMYLHESDAAHIAVDATGVQDIGLGEPLGNALRTARDRVALLEWLAHQDAVRAQDCAL